MIGDIGILVTCLHLLEKIAFIYIFSRLFLEEFRKSDVDLVEKRWSKIQ